jgi:hypothetical protein
MQANSGKGISFKYIDFISTPDNTQTIEFTKNVSETYMTLAQAEDSMRALAQNRGEKSMVLASIQTIDSSGKSSPGHGFNVKANITSSPDQWSTGAILNIGLSNYRDDPGSGRPYVGLRKINAGRFDIVNYHPDRKEQAESMAGTGSLKIASITIRDVDFLSLL